MSNPLLVPSTPPASLPKLLSASSATAAQPPFSLSVSLGSPCTFGLCLYATFSPCPFSGTSAHPSCHSMPDLSHLCYFSPLSFQGKDSQPSQVAHGGIFPFLFFLDTEYPKAVGSGEHEHTEPPSCVSPCVPAVSDTRSPLKMACHVAQRCASPVS